MAKYDIANIVVTAVYDNDLKSTLTFTPKDPGPKKPTSGLSNPNWAVPTVIITPSTSPACRPSLTCLGRSWSKTIWW